MHNVEPKKQALPEKWLADLLSRALLLEYQQPVKRSKRKNKRSGKKACLQSKKGRAPTRESLENNIAAPAQLALTSSTSKATSAQPQLALTAEQGVWNTEDVPVFLLFAQVKRLLGRVQQISQLSAKSAVVILPETAALQHSTDSNDHMCKLLSLPSFGKVVYRSSNFGPTNLAVRKQRSLSGPAARVGTGIDSQQMLLQGHASSLSRPPSLEFDSQFESGNLQKAVSGQEYELWLSPDSSTNGHTQWYFFSIANGKPGVQYRLHIHNFRKAHSLYSQGLQPLLHSAKEASLTGRGWFRVGNGVTYHQSPVVGKEDSPSTPLPSTSPCPMTVTWDLEQLEAVPRRQQCMQRSELCRSLAGNVCPLITITNPSPEPHTPRPAVVFTGPATQLASPSDRKLDVFAGRVHPGESNSSWIMRGLLESLTGPSPAAHALRDKYLFMVVPMLNPDGVAFGNYRCNLGGYDLNRVWQQPDPLLHPTVHATKALLKQLHAARGVALYCDLHGHSRKHSTFMYGCEQAPSPQASSSSSGVICGGGGQNRRPGSGPAGPRLFPFMLQQRCPDLFSYTSSSFRVQRSKAGTARVVCWQELGISNSFTLEASFAGPDTGAFAGTHYDTSQLESIGANLALALLDYSDPVQATQAATAMKTARQVPRQPAAAGLQAPECGCESSGSLSDGGTTDSRLSDSDAEDEGSECAVQQQLASPAARAALTAYSIALAPNGHKPFEVDPNTDEEHEPTTCSEQPCNNEMECSSSSRQQQQRPPLSASQQSRRSPRPSKQRSGTAGEADADWQPLQVQGKHGSSMARDPAKDIARAAARGRPSGVTMNTALSLVPLIRPNAGDTSFRVTSFQPVAGVGPAQYSALEPVEFAIDRPPWRRTSSAQRRLDSLADRSQAVTSDTYEEEVDCAAANWSATPSVVTRILTTAQLDADSMEAARAIVDYPWHYNFIPAARRAPAGTAGFSASSSVEQDRRRSLLQDAAQKRQGLSTPALAKDIPDEPLSSLPPSIHSNISARMMMGYSRSLAGVAQHRSLPSLEINGHPVSLSPDRPSFAARVTIG
ncbi:TPA: hypothetical protein ACH3X1_015010 [Trebouxia sp. C0004]